MTKPQVEIGGCVYTLVTSAKEQQWTAHALRGETSERYGVEVTAGSEDDARARLTRWLTWQYEHTVALDALQQAEKAFHRAIAGSAFASPDAQAAESKPARAAMDAARNALDDIRARRPNV
jgi:hypothetical protein